MELTNEQLEQLAEQEIHVWLKLYGIKNENGDQLDFRDHLYLVEPFEDLAPKQVVLKAAQIGFSTMAIIKSLWVAKHLGLNIVYTLPTADDRNQFVGDKINRIIAQNPILQQYTADKDTIEQKLIGKHMIHYRGTFTQKAAMMVSSDLNIYDEVDASNQAVIEQYATRLQHSKYKYEWLFSHPSAEGYGVDKYWDRSTQKHWFIRCGGCSLEQYMAWPHSVDMGREAFVCKECRREFTKEERRVGRWVKKFKDAEYSGYWIPLLICPWVTAKEIIGYYNDKTEEYFVNKVLGRAYSGSGNKLTKAHLMQNLSVIVPLPGKNDRIVLGVDTGAKIHTVIGTEYGLIGYDESSDYKEVEKFLDNYPRAIAVIDQGGDITYPRALKEKYPGRVFLCTYKEAEGKTLQLVKWGEKDEAGAVQADRNRLIQLVVDEFTQQRIPLAGTENDWYDYWLHWNNLTRVSETNDKTGFIKKIWRRSGADHLAHATVYCRIGLSRFGSVGTIIGAPDPAKGIETSPIQPDGTMIIPADRLLNK